MNTVVAQVLRLRLRDDVKPGWQGTSKAKFKVTRRREIADLRYKVMSEYTDCRVAFTLAPGGNDWPEVWPSSFRLHIHHFPKITTFSIVLSTSVTSPPITIRFLVVSILHIRS